MNKKGKCNIISFGKINLYILLVPLGAVFNSMIDLIKYSSEKFGQEDYGAEQHPIIVVINYAIGLSLSSILFIIYKVRNKSKKNQRRISLDKSHSLHSPIKEISKKEKFLWILLGSFIDFITETIFSYNWIRSDNYIVYWPSNLLLLSIFALIILKMKLYKHHYLCIISITIIGFVFNIVSGSFSIEKIRENYVGYIVYFFAESMFNILYVLYKFFMFKKFIQKYEILFFQGLIELVLGIITLIIITHYFGYIDSYYTYFDGLDDYEIGLFIGLIFVHFATYLTIFIIIDLFTPFHIFLLDTLSQTITYFFCIDFEKYIYSTITSIIILVVCIFMILVFIEIIQLDCCGISFMTKKNIEERARLENLLNNEDNDENLIYDKNEEKIIFFGEYTIELEEIKNSNELTKILPSDLDSVDKNNNN